MKPLAAIMIAMLVPNPAWPRDAEDRGFLDRPPVFIGGEQDIPLPLFGADLPPPGKLVPDFDVASVRSNGWRSNGTPVQPALGVTLTTIRVGGLYGLNESWAAALSIPWKQISIRGGIGGQHATRNVLALGGAAVLGKRVIWRGQSSDQAAVTFGIELPTGEGKASFDQANPSTTAYFGAPLIPASWQPATGSLNGYLGAAYRRAQGRLSYAALIAAKLHTPGYQDAVIGNILILSAQATYGIARNFAFGLGVTCRVQGNDRYPNAPPPGVNQPALAGTTTHALQLSLDPSIRLKVAGRVVVGVGFRPLLIRPDNGMVPDARVYLIFYPSP
jgi:hypothetical protein